MEREETSRTCGLRAARAERRATFLRRGSLSAAGKEGSETVCAASWLPMIEGGGRVEALREGATAARTAALVKGMLAAEAVGFRDSRSTAGIGTMQQKMRSTKIVCLVVKVGGIGKG